MDSIVRFVKEKLFGKKKVSLRLYHDSVWWNLTNTKGSCDHVFIAENDRFARFIDDYWYPGSIDTLVLEIH